MDTNLESNLVRMAQAGDRESYGQLADLYGGSVLAIAYSRVGNFTVSEDIAQDALLVGFEKLDHLRRPQDFGAWLRAIARNLCLRWHRNQAYRQRLSEDCAAVRTRLGYDAPPAPADVVAGRETTRVIEDALQGLPVKEREALLLYYFEEKSVKEAAAAAGISPTAMRKRLQRARDRLRDVFNAKVEAGLLDVAQRRRVSACVAAAMPTGASYSKVASATNVVPSALSLALRGLTGLLAGGGLAKVATGFAAAVIAAGVFVATHDRATSDDASPTLTAESAPALSAPETSPGMEHPPTQLASNGSGVSFAQNAEANGAGGVLLAAAKVPDAPATPMVSGTVRDPDGNPVGDARVEAVVASEYYDPMDTHREVAAEVLTKPDGTYLLHSLPITEEKLLIFVTHADWANGGGRIEPLKEGESRECVDFTLVSPTAVTGVVVTENGEPVPGASVFLAGVSHPDFHEQGERRNTAPWIPAGNYGCFARTTAAKDGTFALDHIPDGWVISRLGAWAPGFALNYAYSKEADERAQQDLASGLGAVWWATDIPPNPGPIRIVLAPGGAVRGRVVLEGTDEPVVAARLVVDGTIGTALYETGRVGYERCAFSDERGEFVLGDQPVAQYRVRAWKDGLCAAPRSAEVKQGETVSLGRIELSAPGTIEGAVYDGASGQPLPGFMLAYQLVGISGAIPWVETDSRGRFRIMDMAAGDWHLWPYASGSWELSNQNRNVGMQDGRMVVSVKSGETLVGVDLHCTGKHDPRGSIKGRVVGPEGIPVAGAEVRTGGSRSIVTDANGLFEVARVQAGTRGITAVDPATRAYGVATVVVPAGETVAADIRLGGTAAQISGRIATATGEPAEPGTQVTVEAYGIATFEARTDDKGTYTTGLVPPGSYRLHCYSPPKGYCIDPRTHELALNEGEDITLDLVLTAMSGFVAGAVVHPDGTPAAGVKVTAGSAYGQVSGTTDDEGRFRLEPIDGDDLYIRAGTFMSNQPWATVRNVAPNTEDLRIVLQAPGNLKGIIVPPPDDPQTPWITVESQDFGTSTQVENGTISLSLQPGTYQVTVRSGHWRREFPEVVIASGMETDLGVVELDAGTGAVVGKVTFTGGRVPEEGALIRVEARASANGSAGMIGPGVEVQNGEYRLDRLYPGRYQVILRVMVAGGTRVLQAPADVGEGGETRLDFTVTLGDASVGGTVAGAASPDGKPRAFVLVFEPGTCPLKEGERDSSTQMWDGFIAMATVLPDGTFILGNLTAGTYDMVAALMGRNGNYERLNLQSVTLGAGQTTALQFDVGE